MLSTMKIAFVVPLDTVRHIKHKSNLAALSTDVSDVYVVLATRYDLDIWNSYPAKPEIKVLVLSDWISEEAIYVAGMNSSLPTFKKWMAMDRILMDYNGDQYSYMICCDCEIQVVKPIDANFISALPTQFNFVGDHFTAAQQSSEIIQKCDEWLSSICEKRKDCELVYSWWSGLPVYNVETLRTFLLLMGVNNPLTLSYRLCWYIFDHLVYQRYVSSRGLHGAKYVCLTHELETPNGWSLERVENSEPIIASRKAGLVTLWARRHFYEKYSLTEPYILYHVDG